MGEIGTHTEDWNDCFLLTADINLIGYNLNSIGDLDTQFTGKFDGNGHTISNFNRNVTGNNFPGLFGWVYGTDSEIKNLILLDPNTHGANYAAALVSKLEWGTITGCGVKGGTVSGDGLLAGGLAGYLFYEPTITNCYSMASVSGGAPGGLVGTILGNGTSISNCYATGDVSGHEGAGGLVGRSYGTSTTITNCYATGSASGDYAVGGLVGLNGSIITQCYATGDATADINYVGGLVGYNLYTISNCYATGDATGDKEVGGLVGFNTNDISYCYAAGAVSGNVNVGGLVGEDYGGSYTSSLWDSYVNPDVNGIGNGTDVGVIGRTTAQMQTKSTFTDRGWDFVGETTNGTNDIWRMCVDDVNYPLLSWQFNKADFGCLDGVDFGDFAVVSLAWLSDNTPTANWNPKCDISEPPDGIIDELDIVVFTDNWLEGK
jgi:hypothetical protein